MPSPSEPQCRAASAVTSLRQRWQRLKSRKVTLSASRSLLSIQWMSFVASTWSQSTVGWSSSPAAASRSMRAIVQTGQRLMYPPCQQ